MDGYTTYYPTSTTIMYEYMLHQYNTDFKQPLNLPQHIQLAIHKDNYNLVDYLINKRLLYLRKIIDNATMNYGFKIWKFIQNDIFFCHNDTTYDILLTHYTQKACLLHGMSPLTVPVKFVIDVIVYDENWLMLASLYEKEKINIINYAKKVDEAY